MIKKCLKDYKWIILYAFAGLVIITIACIIYKTRTVKLVDEHKIQVNNMSVSLHKDSAYQILKTDDDSIYDFQILSDDKAVLSVKIKSYGECNDIIKQCKNGNNKDNIDNFKLDNKECTIISQKASNIFNMVFVLDKNTGQGLVGYSTGNVDTIKDILKQITIC